MEYTFYNKNFSEGVNKWANACLKHEGWFKGSVSQRHNNPGNIRCGAFPFLSRFIKNLGATSCSLRNFAVFPTKEAGYAGLCQFLVYAQQNKLISYTNYANKYNKGIITIQSFYQVYAPTGDFNNPNAYATFIANKLGLSVNSPINQI